jgi:anaerobic sulfite reductase subunit A
MAYRLFGAMLLPPNEERLRAVAAIAGELDRHSEAMVSFPIYSHWKRMLGSLSALDGHWVGELGEEYVRLFMHHPERTPCLPYESVYVDRGGQAVGWVTTLVEREYAVAGLSLSPSLKDLPDHAAVELEFMAFLCAQEAGAWERESLTEGIRALERQASFLDRHLGRWFPQWATEVETLAGEGIYPLMAATAGAFVGQDGDLLEVLLRRLRRLPGAVPEPAAEEGAHLG